MEAWKTRTAAALFDLTSIRRLLVSGPGALELLQGLATSDMASSLGRVTYTLLIDHHGGIQSDTFVAGLGSNLFQVSVNGTLDFAYSARQVRIQCKNTPERFFLVGDATGGTCGIGLWGPRSSEIIAAVCSGDTTGKSLPYCHLKAISNGCIPVIAMRASFVREPGLEIHTSAENGQHLWDVL